MLNPSVTDDASGFEKSIVDGLRDHLKLNLSGDTTYSAGRKQSKHSQFVDEMADHEASELDGDECSMLQDMEMEVVEEIEESADIHPDVQAFHQGLFVI